MEPVTAVAIATLIATGALGRTGEQISEGLWALAGKFINALRRKDQATAAAIETVAQKPELAEQQPANYGIATLVTKAEAAAQEDAEIRQAAQDIQTAVQVQPGAIVNMTKLAEKIGVVNQGTIVNQTNNFSF